MDDIPGFVLTDLTRDISLCDKIEAETGLDIPRGLATVAGGDPSGKAPDGSSQMYRLGHFFFVINPEFFMGLDTFKKTAGGICRGLRDSQKAPGAEPIYTAGEKEWLAWQERKDKGVPVGETIQKEIIEIRDKLGLPYHFPFEDQK